MYSYIFPLVTLSAMLLILLDSTGARQGGRGDLASVPLWNPAPPSRITNRNKGDLGDIDPRGSVRYNIGPNGRIMKGLITRHREVPIDDNGLGLEQAKEECCHPDSY